jgi:hypothetical protein
LSGENVEIAKEPAVQKKKHSGQVRKDQGTLDFGGVTPPLPPQPGNRIENRDF